MNWRALIVSTAIALAVCSYPTSAHSKGRLTAGPVLWKHDTNLQVERATDFDGSSITTDQREKDWDVLGSGAGMRLTYGLPRLLSVYGEVGVTQATVRDKDVVDPNRDIGSLGLNDGGYFGVGLRLEDDFSGSGRYFWAVTGALSSVSTALDEDVFTSWDYDETKLSVDGRLGIWTRPVGLYGGVRAVQSSADLRETDRSNPPGQQARMIELERDESFDLLVGAQSRGSDVAAFTEIGLVGTFSASAGITIGF